MLKRIKEFVGLFDWRTYIVGYPIFFTLMGAAFNSWSYALSPHQLLTSFICGSLTIGIMEGLKSWWFESYDGPKIEAAKEVVNHRICCDDCNDEDEKELHEQALKEIDDYLNESAK